MSQTDLLPKSPGHTEGGTSERRIFAALAYLLPALGGLIALALDGDNPFTRLHARQSIAAVLAMILSFFVWVALGYLIALIPIAGPIVSIALFSLVIATAVFLALQWILSFIAALRGEERRIPLANRIVLRLFENAGATKRRD